MQKKMGNKALLNRVFKQVPIEDILARAEQELGLTVREPDTTTPLKVGDKVRVLPRKEEWWEQGPHYADEMLALEGTLHTVEMVKQSDDVRLSEGRYSWMRHWLDKVEE